MHYVIDWLCLATFMCVQMHRKIVLHNYYPTQLFSNIGYSSNSMHILCFIFLLNKQNHW